MYVPPWGSCTTSKRGPPCTVTTWPPRLEPYVSGTSHGLPSTRSRTRAVVVVVLNASCLTTQAPFVPASGVSVTARGPVVSVTVITGASVTTTSSKE